MPAHPGPGMKRLVLRSLGCFRVQGFGHACLHGFWGLGPLGYGEGCLRVLLLRDLDCTGAAENSMAL